MKNKLLNNYTFFLFGLALLTAFTFIKLPCPACDGTGKIEGVIGIEVTDIEANLISHYGLGMGCGWDWERFTYDIRLTVENPTKSEAWGVIMVTFHNPDDSYSILVEEEDEEVYIEVTGATLLSVPVFVEIPAGNTQVIEKVMRFEGITLAFFSGRNHLIEANLASDFVCPFHDETASVALPEWLRLR